MPLLQGVGQLAADGRVQRLQARLHEGEPGVDPGVDGHSVREWVPVLHLQEEWGNQTMPWWLMGRMPGALLAKVQPFAHGVRVCVGGTRLVQRQPNTRKYSQAIVLHLRNDSFHFKKETKLMNSLLKGAVGRHVLLQLLELTGQQLC